MTMIDSSFTNLAAFGQASVILLNSAVYFDNVTFNSNYQSNAGAINVNQTSNATIVNSVFTNNFGYQAGAIAVGCELACCLSCSMCASLLSFCSCTLPSFQGSQLMTKHTLGSTHSTL
jgi:adenine C2-methylase RlmN of 23S rRNA A2503 and tRNA A37